FFYLLPSQRQPHSPLFPYTTLFRSERLTHETQIMVELDLDGIGVVEVGTGVPFFDHMLAQLGKHGSLDLTVRAKGDVEIDAHHTDRKSTRLNSSHDQISYAVFCLKK